MKNEKAWKCAKNFIMGKIKQHDKKMAGPLLEMLSTLKLYINNVIRWLIIREIPVKFLLDLLNISEWSDVFIFINSRINIFEVFEIFDTDRFNRSPGSFTQLLTNYARKYQSVQKQIPVISTATIVREAFQSKKQPNLGISPKWTWPPPLEGLGLFWTWDFFEMGWPPP